MNAISTSRYDDRMRHAIEELSTLIRSHFPGARFTVGQAQDDAEILLLYAQVGADSIDEVLDVVMDRMLEFQVDEGLPIYVIPELRQRDAAALA